MMGGLEMAPRGLLHSLREYRFDLSDVLLRFLRDLVEDTSERTVPLLFCRLDKMLDIVLGSGTAFFEMHP